MTMQKVVEKRTVNKGSNGGKQKYWRKHAQKFHDGATEIRTGRRLKAAMSGGTRKGLMTPMIAKLFHGVGIETPVLDRLAEEMHNNSSTTEEQTNEAV